MLSVVVIWLYMMVTMFLLGYGILTGVAHFCPYKIRHQDSYVMCGLAGATVYAQFYSIFAQVGRTANLLLCGICLAVCIFRRKRLLADLRDIWQKVRGKQFLLLLFVFFLCAYGTSRGIIHYDTSLYHAQSIRWIEEYGLVKGLGNLHCRLAYNSASFALSALYSMAFLGGQSYHCAAGFLAFLTACVCLRPEGLVGKKQLKASAFARVMGIYYLFVIFDEMISPASDYFMVLTAFYLIIRWMDLLEERETSFFPYAMLCVLGVFSMTVKLSAALILLLVIKPAGVLLKEKRWKETGLFFLLGIVTAAPYLIRNLLISGWLVYPFTGIDIIRADWKIPQGIAAYDAKEIQVWGRGYSDVTQYGRAPWEWLPEWFRGLGTTDQLFVLAAVLSAAVFFLRLLCFFAKAWKHKSIAAAGRGDALLLEGTVCVCFLFWIFSSPLIRYGCVYVYLTSAVVWGDVLTEFFRNKQSTAGQLKRCLEWAVTFGIALFLLYKTAAFGAETAASYVNAYWIYQKDYENYETKSYEIDGFTFYCPVTGDKTGYKDFPSSPAKAQIGLRGDTIGDGFLFRE